MKAWLQQVWADRVARVALVLAVITTIPAWFIWSGEPLMEAVDAVVIAIFLATLWLRRLLGPASSLAAVAVAVAVVGLLSEAAFYLIDDDRPLVVALIFPAGLFLLLLVAFQERRDPSVS
jgi:hypothetical protein